MKGAALLLAIFAALEAARPWCFEALRYDRDGLRQGELWRLLSAHFVHLGPVHALMNGIGVVLLVLLFKAQAHAGKRRSRIGRQQNVAVAGRTKDSVSKTTTIHVQEAVATKSLKCTTRCCNHHHSSSSRMRRRMTRG